MRSVLLLVASAALLLASVAVVIAQRPDAFSESREHPAIAYNTAPVNTVISELNRKLDEGAVKFTFDPTSGYLRSALDALGVPIESQMLVYTQTSLQAQKIGMQNPRAVYFNDDVSVAWVRGGTVLEAWAQDPRQGTIFYTLDQQAAGAPRFGRQLSCLSCHLSWDTLGVPGPSVLTTFPRKTDRDYANGHTVDHRSEIAERWGGWYVTGRRAPARHMGNVPLFMSPPFPATSAPRSSVEGAFDLAGYPTPYSDVVALMVLEHQTRMMNLITRVGWESRVAAFREGNPSGLPAVSSLGGGNPSGLPARGSESPGSPVPTRVRDAVNDLVDYMLFVDEAPITGRIEGSSGFAEKFSAMGPRDRQGRSLRELQLETRLMRYPLSYMIYTQAFDALAQDAKDLAYRRLGEVLSAADTRTQYAHLAPAIRRAIVEILRDTKRGVVDGF